MGKLQRLCRHAWVLALCWGGVAGAQTLSEPDEWAERIKTAESIAPVGTDLFGDSTNFYNGQTSFSATDIDLPGNSALPVRLARKLGNAPTTSDFAQLLGNWDLDLPYMSGIYQAGRGWQNASGGFNRCSGPLVAPNVTASNVLFWGSNYWRSISMNVPGSGAQTVLYASPANNQRPSDGQTTRYVTSKFWQIRCLSQIANPSGEAGFTGEGFEAVSPEGLRYRFDWMTRQYFTPLKRGYPNFVATLNREEIRLYATRVQDHHGNWVQYSYSGSRLTGITANDGRAISLTYDSAGHVKTASAHGRTWQYGYDVETITARLNRVTLPDGSAWAMSGSIPKRVLYAAGSGVPTPPCGHPGSIAAGQNATITLTHPSGATGQFVLTPVRRARSETDNSGCTDDNPDPNTRYVVPKSADAFALLSKTISGPSLAAQTWNVSYNTTDVTLPTPTTQWTQVTNPDSTRVKYTYGNRWYVDEGKLLTTETYSAASALLRSESSIYALGAASGPYPYVTGDTAAEFEDAFAETRLVPANRTVISQSGDTYTAQINSFDLFARPLGTTRSNSFGGTRTDVTAYHDSYLYWRLGQVRSVTNSNTGLVESSAVYGTASVRPESLRNFGLLTKTATYNTDGTLGTLADGLARTTTFTNWKRGLPQNIAYPDTTASSAVVNDSGWITSVTDALTNQTGYGYDAAGRLSVTNYPTGDTVSWSSRVNSYGQLTIAEEGIPVNSWRRVHTHGGLRATTYYDARFQPILEKQQDTTTGISYYTRRSFDFEGRTTFESYPSATNVASAGILTSYDALSRVIQRRTTDGIVLEQINHSIGGGRTQITDADGKVTTISYQAFGEPDQSRPTLIAGQEGQTTTIGRDVFGKITTITQSGLYNGSTLSATRSFAFDSFQRPCRRLDPESRATYWGYDAASQITWEAEGQVISSCPSAAPTDASLFQYDAMGRKKLDDHPGIEDDNNYVYDLAGNLTSLANGIARWDYTYNKRNLIETEQAQVDGRIYLLNPQYNSQGNVFTVAQPDNFVVGYLPDVWGRPRSLSGAGSTNTTFASSVQYHPNGLISSYNLGNGLSYSQSLNNRLWPQLQQTLNGSSVIQKFNYLYFNSGDLNVLDDQLDNTNDATLTYDNLHRLKTATGLWGSYTYTYDPLNNLRSRTGSSTLNYFYNSSNLLSTINGAQFRSYSYNAKGEITGDGTGKVFTLNNQGQITNIDGVASYRYDGHGRRIRTAKANGEVEYALYDRSGKLRYTEVVTYPVPADDVPPLPPSPVALPALPTVPPLPTDGMLPLSIVSTHYLNLGGQTVVQVKDGTPTYLHSDLLGSPRKATNASRSVLWNEHYDPYGRKLNNVQNKIGYTGYAFDSESGYTYMQARFYDPLVGRFLSTDPIHFQDDNPFTFNRYAYANNNPYRYKDPNGKYAEAIFEAVSLSVGVNSFIDNATSGNFGSAAVDAVGVVLDIVAAALPGVPGVVGLGITAGREGSQGLVSQAAGKSGAPISGNAQVTKSGGRETSHATTSQRIANEQASRPDAKTVHLNQTVKTITGGEKQSAVRPDVGTVRQDGKVDVNEVLSPGQDAAATAQKYTDALGDKAGTITCVSQDKC